MDTRLKKTKAALLLAALGVASLGCGYENETSKVLTEPVEVTEVIHSPSQHGSGIGMGVGVSSSGNMVTSIVPTSIDIPEKFVVVLKCPHGKYILESRQLWEVLKIGDKGEAEYVENYRVKRSNGEITEKHLTGYHTLNIVRDGRRVLQYNR